MRKLESELQCKIIEWVRWNENKISQLKLLFAIPNGGKRDVITGARLKKEGVLPGVYDMFLAYPNKNYHGLFIELKIHPNSLSKNQKQFKKIVEEQNYKTIVCYTFDEFVKGISEYLEIEVNK